MSDYTLMIWLIRHVLKRGNGWNGLPAHLFPNGRIVNTRQESCGVCSPCLFYGPTTPLCHELSRPRRG